MDKAILALGMYTLLGQGDRDMSCGGLVILVAAVIGLLYGKGVNIAVCLLIALTIAVVAVLQLSGGIPQFRCHYRRYRHGYVLSRTGQDHAER